MGRGGGSCETVVHTRNNRLGGAVMVLVRRRTWSAATWGGAFAV